MRNLTDDSVMSNCISADTEFHINHRQVELQTLFLLLGATDGCFAYVRSPMHFEHLLLSTLQEARDAIWRRALEGAVTAITGDDAAMALLGFGADLGGFKKLFKTGRPRWSAATSTPSTNSTARCTTPSRSWPACGPAGPSSAASCGASTSTTTSATWPWRYRRARRRHREAGDVINGYTILEDFRVVGAGLSNGLAAKDGREYFIKEFLSPTYPDEHAPGSPQTKMRKRQRCAAFERHHRRINEALAEISASVAT